MSKPLATYKMRRKIATLERRADHLADILDEQRGTQGSLDRVAAELAALEFALDTIEAHYQQSEDQP